MKKKINQIIVVEGSNDAAIISSLYDAEIVVLNGCELANIKYLKAVTKKEKILILTDPDHEGEILRKKLNSQLKNYDNINVSIDKIIKDKKGVAEAPTEEIQRVLDKYVVNEQQVSKILNINYLCKNERDKICEKLDIERTNNKTFIKRMNRLNINEEKIKELLNQNGN